MLKVVEGIYKSKSLKLFKPLDLQEGQLVKAIIIKINQKRSQIAKERQFSLLDKGIDMGRILMKNREELHER